MTHPDPLCIEEDVDPLLSELRGLVTVFHADRSHPARPELHGFIRTVFRRAHDARVELFYPGLLGYRTDQGLRAVVGYRPGLATDLFAEQYLDLSAERLISNRIGRRLVRGNLVEVGNLALSDPGHARWVIASSTAFLAAAGYRWVLFTATRPLANAFRRLGLRPVHLAEADPARLPDGGAAWGSYYGQNPAVYAGDILAGAAKLEGVCRPSQPHLQALLRTSRRLGLAARLAASFAPSTAGAAP